MVLKAYLEGGCNDCLVGGVSQWMASLHTRLEDAATPSETGHMCRDLHIIFGLEIVQICASDRRHSTRSCIQECVPFRDCNIMGMRDLLSSPLISFSRLEMSCTGPTDRIVSQPGL